jgi:hypothetical protein
MLSLVGIPTFPFTWRHLVVKVIIYINMLFMFSTPMLIRHQWQLKTAVVLHWCLICPVLLIFLPNLVFFLRLSGRHKILQFGLLFKVLAKFGDNK